MEVSCRSCVALHATRPFLEGALSFEAGFMPARVTSPSLPASHRVWDEVASELPRLFASNRARSVLAKLPELRADAEALPDSELRRAAVVLSALAHAYWRFGPTRFFPRRITQVSPELPQTILRPWQAVSRRLGRHRPERPFQNFYDLFLANYVVREGLAPGAPRIIENMEVLVASFRNEAERVFYMSFVEMHHHLTPLILAICEIEAGIAADDASSVVGALARIDAGLGKAASVWNKISARPGSRVFCDPVAWSKTAAILGVPPGGTPQGATSGACAPMLHALDALLGRERYDSHYGRFVCDQARDLVPSAVREFCELAARIGLRAYVDARRGARANSELSEAFDGLVAVYSGDRGWLGRHAAKVFGYLCISTITGRNASVSGHERYFSRQTWVEASAELHESRAERHAGAERAPPARIDVRTSVSASAARQSALPSYGRVDVARHREDGDAWIVIDEYVYDVTSFLDKHPGGMAILRAYAGQDVSHVFWGLVVHHGRAVPALLDRLRIGRVRAAAEEALDPVLYAALTMLIRCDRSSRMQYEHAMDGHIGLKLFSDEHAHMLLVEENLPAVFELLAPGTWAKVGNAPDARRVRSAAQRLSSRYDFGEPLSPELAARVDWRERSLREADLGLTARLVELAIQANSGLEGTPPGGVAASSDTAAAARSDLVEAMEREVARYFAGLARS